MDRLDDRRRRRLRPRSTCSRAGGARRKTARRRDRPPGGSPGRSRPRSRYRQAPRPPTRSSAPSRVRPRPLRRHAAPKLGSRKCSNRPPMPAQPAATEPIASTINAHGHRGRRVVQMSPRMVHAVHGVHMVRMVHRVRVVPVSRSARERRTLTMEGHEHEAEHVGRRQQRRQHADDPQQPCGRSRRCGRGFRPC